MTTIDDIEQLFRNNYKALLIFANLLVFLRITENYSDIRIN